MDTPPIPSDGAADGRAPQSGPTTLVVDDEAALRTVTRRVLAREGHAVLEAGSGAEAEAVAASHAGPIDLLVTDIVLPDTDGRALAALLRARHPTLRVLVVSGYGRSGPEGSDWGRDAHFLAKPYTPASLAAAVREAFAR
jgi:CheY-like chemotaxis protein